MVSACYPQPVTRGALPTLLLLIVSTWSGPALAAPETSASPTDKVLLRGAARLARKVRVQRQLKLRRQLKMEVLARDALAARRLALLEARMDKEAYALQSRILAALGLVEPGADTRAELIRRLTAGEPGPFYDPAKQKIYIVKAIPLKDQRQALALATCHALVDQRFRLRRLGKLGEKSQDAHLAARALAEGDCFTLMLELLLAKEGLEPSALGEAEEQLLASAIQGEGRVSDFLQKRIQFPYMAGAAFVTKLRARYAWAVLRKAYKRPPESTEQVLHYERYWTRDRPDRFRAPALKSLAGAAELGRDTVGEFQLGRYLSLGVDKAGAARAAAGWGGDLLLALEEAGQGKGLVLVHLTSWDTDMDATEFAGAQAHVFSARDLAAEATGDAALWRYKNSSGRVWSQRLMGRYVLTLMGAPADGWEALEAEVRKRWRINGRRLK